MYITPSDTCFETSMLHDCANLTAGCGTCDLRGFCAGCLEACVALVGGPHFFLHSSSEVQMFEPGVAAPSAVLSETVSVSVCSGSLSAADSMVSLTSSSAAVNFNSVF